MRWRTGLAALAMIVAGTVGGLAQSANTGDVKEGGSGNDVIKDSDSRTPPAMAPQGGDSRSADYFTLEVCNRDRRKAFVALSSRESPAAKDWYVAGWWTVQPGNCVTLGRYPRPTVYVHAEDVRGGQWRGRDLRACVEKQRFKRVVYPGHTCPNNLLRGFFAKKITADRYVWNLNP